MVEMFFIFQAVNLQSPTWEGMWKDLEFKSGLFWSRFELVLSVVEIDKLVFIFKGSQV